jgi:hypothetical protein
MRRKKPWRAWRIYNIYYIIKYSANFLCLGQVIRANQAVRKISPRTTYAQATHEIIPTSSPIEGTANKWTAKAKDKTTWHNLIKAWWKETQQSQTIYQQWK